MINTDIQRDLYVGFWGQIMRLRGVNGMTILGVVKHLLVRGMLGVIVVMN